MKGIGRLHTNLRERVRGPGETETCAVVSLRLLEDKGWLDLAGEQYAFARRFPRRGEARVGGDREGRLPRIHLANEGPVG